MYDDISNLKDKFQEDAFDFQDFSSPIIQENINKIESKIIDQDNNQRVSLKSDLSNNTFSETSPCVKNESKQPVTLPSSYHQDALAIKAKKENLIKGQPNLLVDNSISDNKKTDKDHANEQISLKDILSFIASV